jgi:hypothetical protein
MRVAGESLSGQRHSIGQDRHTGRRIFQFVMAALVSAVACIALSFGSLQGAKTVNTIDSHTDIVAARLQDAYFNCLRRQTQSVIGPGATASISASSFYVLGTILQVDGDWLTFVQPTDLSVPAVSLVPRSKGPSCRGMAIEVRLHRPGGGFETRFGTGASLPGHGPLPPEQL